MKHFKLKFLLLFFALAMAIPPAWAGTVTDVITAADLPAPEVNTTNFTYTAFTDKHFTSDALYSGNTANYKGAIVFNNNNSNKGIFTTVSGGKVKSVTIEWYSGTANDRKMQFFGKNEAYTSIGDLYSTSSSVQGTKIAEIQMSDNNLTQTVNIEGDYQYIGIRCSKSATNVNKITIVWETEGGDEPPTTDPTLKIGTESLTINDSGTNNSFTVKGENLVDNIGVTPIGFEPTLSATVGQPRDNWDNGTHYFWFERDGENVDGTVAVNYTSTDLYAEGTITMGTKPYQGAPDEENITKTVNVTYRPDIYIIGDFGEGWKFNDGSRKMTFNGTTYTATVEMPANSYFVFARKLNDTGLWDDGRSYFGPNANNWPVNGTVTDQELVLTAHNVFQVNNAGEYIITINPTAKTFSITSSNVANIAEAQEFDGTFTFTGTAVVTYQKGNNLWILDDSGSGLIYGSVGSTFVNGNTLKTGWKANKSEYNGNPQFSNPTGVEKDSDGQTVAPEALTSLPSTTDANKYVSMSNVTVTRVNDKNYYIGTDDNEFCLRDHFNNLETALEKDHVYNVIGVVNNYNGTPQLYLISATDVTPERAKTPTFSPEAGTYYEAQNVAIACETEEAIIRYTTDGSDPTETSTVYENPIAVGLGETMTIKAIAMKDGMNNSTIAEATYTVIDPSTLTTYRKVTSTDDLTDGNYLIVSEGVNAAGTAYQVAFDGSLETLDAYKNIFNVTIENDEIKTNVNGYFTYDATAQTLKSASGYYIAQTAYSNGLKQSETADDEFKNTVTIDENGNAVITALGSNEGNKMVTLRYNFSSDQQRFRYYKTGQKDIQLYKEVKATPEPVDPELAFDEETPTTVYVGDVVTLAVDNVPEDATLSFTCKPEGAVTFGANGKATFNTVGEVIITAHSTATDEYTAGTATFIINVEARPKVETDLEGNNLDLVAVVGESETGTIIVSGTNLKDDITLTLNDEKGVFAIDVTSIAKNDAIGEVTVTYTPKAATGEVFDEANITIKSTDAEDVTVRLTGMATLPDPVLTVSTEALEMGTKPTDTFTVTGQHLTENVTVSIKEGSDAGFSVAPTSIEATNGAIENATVTVTYSGTSTTDAIATVVVKSGTASKEVIVSAHVLPTPVIEIDGETLDLGTTGKGTFDLLAEDLRGNITLESDNENFTVLPTTITPEEAEEGVTITVTYNGDNTEGETAHITISTDGIEDIVVTVTAKAETYVDLAAPTFSPKAGTYTEAKQVAIACATPGVTIEYTIDGVTKTYDGPFTVDHSCTVTATAKKGTRTVYTPATNSATYTINAVPAAEIADKFYYLQNNALSGKYANVAGRRTLNFVDNADEQAGTVFRVETGADGAVKTLRSQAVDLQGYANRAMAYVPKAIEFVLSTLNNASDVDDATGAGNILGENGVQLILKKFYENFDYNLYVESTEGAYRIYGRTPSMQHVVDFYHENTAQVEEKLPMLEDYINQVIAKIRSKVPAGMNANVFEDFSLVKVWEKMGGKLIKPEGAENVMAFYRQVLNNKEYVWDFAYQTAMIYLDNIKGTQTYQSIPDEYKAYVEKMQNIRPETKYYMIQNGNEPDYVSENNTKIINNDPSTLWTLTERQTFTVSFPEANLLNGNYYTTLYTDFAYDVPEGVTAYKVTGVNSNAIAEIEAIGKNVPAQTPVLLMTAAAKANVTKTVTMNTNDGTPIENELKGPDYLIKTYEITAPTVESLFAMAAGIVPADMLAQYEYLKLRTSGTVNNKYMWGLSNDDINKCSYLNANNENDCVVRSLDAEEGTVAFSDHWTVATNKAFLVSETNDVIYLSMDTVAEPTFSPVPGSYTAEQQVTITCATEEATIKYSTDGGQTWNTYKGSIAASDDMTIVAKAEKNGMIASNEVTAVYVIDLPTELPDVPAMKGYYQIKNNGNGMYANIAGRRTLNFTDAPADKAGTVIWLETNDKGQVQSIRSQAADLQGYANRAMNYVPDIVELVADKLNADGVGNLLGHEGLEKIMEKFNESFDHHLYVEQAGENGWRLYGKTPSMQPVVDFYRENTAQVEAKLPMLEDFINSALDKLKEKIGGSSVFTPFSLHQIWENMGETLTEPNDDASIMAFYREVLNNKNYVWDFAYQTAMIYVNNLKNHPRYNEVEDMLGEYAQYINMIEQVRPDFKYYIVQKNDKPDFISEGNVDITNNAARTIWTLEPRTKFNVSIAENLFGCPLAGGVGGYATTLYTDFAYSVPDGVTAYKVTSIEGGNATIEALSGVIPAQTPVLLTAKEASTVTLTLSTEAGTAVTGNLLVGPDYLINEYDLKTEQIQGLFDMIKDKLGQSFYDAYVAQYEHLMYLNSGTVNNKYFWGLKESDVEKCSNDGGENCVVRNLEGGKFIDNWKVETNKAFLVTDEYAEITMSILHGDVNHDGKVNIQDVTDLIDRRLVRPDAEHLVACEYCSDVNQDGKVDIQDVTDLIDILLGNGTDTTVPDEGEGDGN